MLIEFNPITFFSLILCIEKNIIKLHNILALNLNFKIN